MKLYNYWRSSAAWRVRIALAFKHLDYEAIPIDLRCGEQAGADYVAVNPQGLVPFLIDGDVAIGQSLAILEYLEETYPAPALLPSDPGARARVRMLAEMIACDIHPIQNLRVLKQLRATFDVDQAGIDAWARHWIDVGFVALEAEAAKRPSIYLAADQVTLADVCLVPQIGNARRFGCDLAHYPRLVAIEQRLLAIPAFETKPEANFAQRPNEGHSQ